MKDNDPMTAADDDARVDEAACDPDTETARTDDAEASPDTFVLEMDGQAHTLPIALKGAFLRQADYTRKTQELASHRRAREAERAAVAEATHDRLQLAALDHQLAGFEGVDWQAYANADPDAAQALHDRFQALLEARGRLVQAVAQHEHGRRLQAAQDAAQAMAETGRTLAREIPGWSPELAARLAEYALAQGVTHEELAAASDPRVWKVLHKAYRAEEGAKHAPGASTQAVRPAVSVAGAAASSGGVRDELATKDWMRRRNEQVLKSR
jgi:hypothetical protein